MKTNFKEYLEKKKAQQKIDKIAKQFENKSVVLYGAGFFAGDLLRNYDFSKLNIIGVADKKFQNDLEGDFYGYQKLAPEDLLETEFNLLLLITYDDQPLKEYLKNDLFQGENKKCKIKVLITMNILEYINYLLKES